MELLRGVIGAGFIILTGCAAVSVDTKRAEGGGFDRTFRTHQNRDPETMLPYTADVKAYMMAHPEEFERARSMAIVLAERAGIELGELSERGTFKSVELFEAVNDEVNSIMTWQSDPDTFGQEDYFAAPDELPAAPNGQLLGDCDDFTVFKMAVLIYLGVDVRSIGIVGALQMARNPSEDGVVPREAHMWLHYEGVLQASNDTGVTTVYGVSRDVNMRLDAIIYTYGEKKVNYCFVSDNETRRDALSCVVDDALVLP